MDKSDDTTLPKIDLSPKRLHNPTEKDIAAWNALSDDEKRAIIIKEMDDAEADGFADRQTMAEMIAEFRGDPAR